QPPVEQSPRAAEEGRRSPAPSDEQPGGFEIGLGAYRFDPLRYDEAIPASLRAREEECAARPCHYIVQFARPLREADRQALVEGFGLKLREYVPKGAYVERLAPEAARELCARDLVRACLAYQPAFKLSPHLRREPHVEVDGRPALLAVLFDEADPGAVSSSLAAAGGQVLGVHDDRPLGGAVKVRFTVPDLDQLERIAHIEGIRWVEKAPRLDEDDGPS
ncbi:MAG TPA: hypothetical protein VKZ63_11550, partial [Kofleriaceae bacterium]|nr:hypothetical protein [Kofleriaceae bacterium]